MASIISAGTTSGTSLNLSADTSGVLQLATNGTTTAVTIDTSQNVGIGTGSPSKLLDVAGNAAITGTGILSLQRPIVPVFGQGTPQLTFQYYTTGTTYTTGAQIQGIADGSWSSTSAPTNMLFYTCPSASTTIAERMRITSSGNLLVGTTTNNTSGGVIQVSNGITFPATQSASSDANTLDDYEEGTWTPTDTSGAGLSFTVTGAQYVKVGQMVTAIAIFSYPSTANANVCSVGGLPFTTNLSNSTGSILSSNAGAQKMICSGGTTILLFPVNSVNQSANSTLSGATIYLSITYRANA